MVIMLVGQERNIGVVTKSAWPVKEHVSNGEREPRDPGRAHVLPSHMGWPGVWILL